MKLGRNHWPWPLLVRVQIVYILRLVYIERWKGQAAGSFSLSLTMYNTNKVFLGQGLPIHLAIVPG